MIKTLLLLCMATAAFAKDRKTGDFDYYVLALSWSPTWCALDADREAEQCARGANFGFVMHGLWPQYAPEGWPEYCRTRERDPSRGQTRDMADIMGSSGLAWYQWKKHGRCTGLSSRDYYDTARRAFETVVRPEILRRLNTPMDIPPHVVEAAFLEENPDMVPDGVTVTCKAGHLKEVRICLNHDLSPRECTGRVQRDCRASSTKVLPVN